MEKTTRYYIWRDIICDILTAIEGMEVKEGRVASENRVPTFLIDLAEYGKQDGKSSNDESKTKSRGKKQKPKATSGLAAQSTTNRRKKESDSKKKAAQLNVPINMLSPAGGQGAFGAGHAPVCTFS
jgi:hypothetical protein